MASIAKAIADNGINATIDWLEYLAGELTSVEYELSQGEASEADWETAAIRLTGAIFEAAFDHTINGLGNWPAWLAYQLGTWTGEGWGETDQWMHNLNDLIKQIDHHLLIDYGDIIGVVVTLVASNIIAVGQEGFTVTLADQPAAVLYELSWIISEHVDLYTNVMTELADGRYGLRHVAVPVPAPAPAPAPAHAPTVYLTAADQRIGETIIGLISVCNQSTGKPAKVRGVVAIYEFIWTVPEFLRRYPNFTYLTLIKISEFFTYDRQWFANVEGGLSCDVLLVRTLETFTGGVVAEYMPVLVRSHLRHHADEHPAGKQYSILGAEHIDNLCGHAVRFAPTLDEIMRNTRRLRSGTVLCAEPIVLPNHVHTSETHEIVVIAPETMWVSSRPGIPPVAVHPFFGGGDGGDEPTDPRPLVVYDDDFLDIPGPAAPAPNPSPNPSPPPYADDFEEIEYNSDSDGDVFDDDCDSDGIWERVEAHHRDAMLGLIE